jgi:peptidoglycan/LPS O-acetylase OafA/YrhL
MDTQNSYLASKPHYEILDGLRGVASVMVVAFHLLEAHSGGSHLE